MTKAVKAYVRYMDSTNELMGKIVMFFVLGMMGILLYETISRTIFNNAHVWAVEFAQFVMAAYYTLGGGYSHLIEGQVRMDIFYHKWSSKRKATMDVITFSVLIFYLGVLLHGAIKGIKYALKYKQVSYSSWAPPVAPIKIIMTVGIILMILQTLSEFFKDVARARGEDIPRPEEISTGGEIK